MNGYKGSVSLDFLAKRTLSASRQRCKADDLTPADRINGIEIAGKLKKLYQITNDQIKNSNFLTRFLNWIREIFSKFPNGWVGCPIIPTYEWVERDFLTYSRAKYIQQFGLPERKDDLGYEVVAKEAQIRALLVRA